MTGLVNMPPRSPLHDLVDRRNSETKAFGQFAVGDPVVTKAADFTHITFGQASAAMGFTAWAVPHKASLVGVADIFGLRAPLQVFGAVVQFVTVKMIGDMLLRWLRPTEGFKHKPVHNPYGTASIAGEADLHVAAITQVLSQNPATGSAHTFSDADILADDSSDAGMAGNLVGRLKARHRPPFFNIHPTNIAHFMRTVNPIRS